jgi:ABC-type Zn uptake system ZnuABC Zn-binding protein ZnuA
MRVRFLAAVLTASALAFAACSGGDAPGERLVVVVSEAPVAEWVAAAGGEEVSVRTLVPLGADIHTFTLSPDDLRAVGEADLVVLVGAGLEAPFEEAVRQSVRGRLLVLADVIEFEPFPDAAHGDGDGHPDEEGHGPLDPHIWLDPDRSAAAARAIAQVLGELRPERREQFAANAEAYAAKLAEADVEVRSLLANLPEERRYLVTFHDAYGYFARRYGLEILGFVVENPDEEPSAAQVAALIGRIRELGVTRIYREPQFSARVIDQIARETGAEVRELPSHPTPEHRSLPDLWRAMARAIAGD